MVRKAGRVARQDRLVDQILRDHRRPQAVQRDDDHVLAEKVQREDAVDGRPMNRLRPVPLPIDHRLEAPEPRVL